MLLARVLCKQWQFRRLLARSCPQLGMNGINCARRYRGVRLKTENLAELLGLRNLPEVITCRDPIIQFNGINARAV
jgi:hypothetical protein